MSKKLTSNTLFLDIETMPTTDENVIERICKSIAPPANYKKQDTIDRWMAENYEDEAKSRVGRTALSGGVGGIITTTYAFGEDDVVCLTNKEMSMDGEKDLMERFIKVVNDRKLPYIKLVGHNIINFDILFLKQRAMILGVKGLRDAIPLHARYSGDQVYDTMTEWAGFRNTIKLVELCEFFGIPCKTALSSGDQVYGVAMSGDWDTVTAYAVEDIVSLREVYRRMSSI